LGYYFITNKTEEEYNHNDNVTSKMIC